MKLIDLLIIDDEKKFAAMLAARLKVRGCSCEIRHDGATAIQWLKENSCNLTLILLDLQLPDLYGTEVLTEIKNINPAIPVVILTGHGTENDRQQCMRLGAHKFMHKPLKIDTLMTILNRFKEMTGC